VAHPQLVDVFGRHALIFAADVPVHVDDAGQHVVAAQIDFPAPARELRALGLDACAAGRADRHHVHDAVALDHDVGGAERRRTGTGHDGDVAQDELRIRSLAFTA
jgi:hypothetical protein